MKSENKHDSDSFSKLHFLLLLTLTSWTEVGKEENENDEYNYIAEKQLYILSCDEFNSHLCYDVSNCYASVGVALWLA